jgi:hypothetical protein
MHILSHWNASIASSRSRKRAATPFASRNLEARFDLERAQGWSIERFGAVRPLAMKKRGTEVDFEGQRRCAGGTALYIPPQPPRGLRSSADRRLRVVAALEHQLAKIVIGDSALISVRFGLLW